MNAFHRGAVAPLAPVAPAPSARPALNVGFVLAPSFTMVAFSGFLDALRLAADEGDRSRPIHCRWSVLAEELRPQRASNGVEVMPTARLGDPSAFDYIVVVGGLLHGEQKVPAAVTEFLRAAAARGVPLVGLCTGAFVLARAGLMEGRRCCVSWYHHQEFVREFPLLRAESHEMFVVDRDRLTCAGGTSVVHLAAWLLERHCGKAAAGKALRILLEEGALPARTPQPQPELAESTADQRVRQAMWLMEQNRSSPMPLPAVAQQVHLSVRHLERRFRKAIGMSPHEFSVRLRLRHAHWLASHTQMPLSQIALECGFSDSSSFSRRFREVFSYPASTLRRGQAGVEAAGAPRPAAEPGAGGWPLSAAAAPRPAAPAARG
ncbi:GlxA family transcriptional regulator [Azohydromonas lata]|uniref:GlxA family transcriptional regulator n=1 Tax=Azohydromonas lata TaxID=45677 RepID=A0ABU5IAZ2_9BURK|nr:GlxA family transcriptional regulator [Azohydromonas lata]MDZ5456097.1 GlxA family transcriptional regulator [Azohydromonas lata]